MTMNIICSGCGLEAESDNVSLDNSYNASWPCMQSFYELSAFTVSLRDKDFIHQLVVDAYVAQHYHPGMKPIRITFALIGLYLTFERGYTGREVQIAHMSLGKTRRDWPGFNPPAGRATLTVRDVLQDLTDANYKEKINAWGKPVWELWLPERENIKKLLGMYLATLE